MNFRPAGKMLLLVFLVSVLGLAQPVASQRPVVQDNSDRPKVKPRPSTDAQLAKGEINFDDLRMDIEKDGKFEDKMLTDRIKKKINGKNVKLRGYMHPSSAYSLKGIKQFILVRDNQECCFGPGAAIFDCVIVEMNEGKTAEFGTRPVTVEGKFKVETEKYKYPGGEGPGGASHMAVFVIKGDAVK